MDVFNEGVLSHCSKIDHLLVDSYLEEEIWEAEIIAISETKISSNSKFYILRSQYCHLNIQRNQRCLRLFQWTIFRVASEGTSCIQAEELCVQIFPNEPEEISLIHDPSSGKSQLTFNGREIIPDNSNGSKKRKRNQESSSQQVDMVTQFSLITCCGILKVVISKQTAGYHYSLYINDKQIEF
mmetsp:Transcript_3391/g.4775  ORF Transcript_3391/g.4775 Transcript_3391/m.4775 type:complete len:183 (+) Transcript_3391:50-598(+)